MIATMTPPDRPQRHHRYEIAAAAGSIAVMVVLAAMAYAIVASRADALGNVKQRFDSRAQASAEVVGSYLADLTHRTVTVARRYFETRPDALDLPMASAALGLSDAEILGEGRVLAVSSPRALLALTSGETAELLADAAAGRAAVTGVLPGHDSRLIAIAVPFGPAGTRVLLATLAVSASPLGTYLKRAWPMRAHQAVLVDQSGQVISADPPLRTAELGSALPALARALSGRADGEFAGPTATSYYVEAAVPDTPWHLVLAEPEPLLFASDDVWSGTVPWIAFGAMAALSLALLFIFLRALAARLKLQSSWARMELEAHTDALTGLFNRRQLEATLRQLRRAGTPYSLLMIDLDGFKQVNDHYGHAAGDEVLRQVANQMRLVLRDTDLLGRWGGDEFLAVLPGAGPLDAGATATRLQKAVMALGPSGNGDLPPISLSIGSASTAPNVDVLAEADRALYEAKASRTREPALRS